VADRSRPQRGFALQGVLTLLLILALIAAVVLLLAERNQRRYFLETSGRVVSIDRGLPLPYGHAPFHPTDPGDARTYRPFELPADMALPSDEAFDDRLELDRRWADLLLQTARARLASGDPEHLQQGMDLLARVDALPQLTAEQLHLAHQLRSEVAFVEATDKLGRAMTALRETLSLLRLGSDSPNGHARESADLLDRLVPAVEQLQRAARSEGVMPADTGELPAVDGGDGAATAAVTSGDGGMADAGR
jgi:hypothetical protein